MRQYALIRFKDSKLSTLQNKHLLYLGEIPNMPGHCALCDGDRVLYGYHISNFEEVPEDET
jgi:hypothetical protein